MSGGWVVTYNQDNSLSKSVDSASDNWFSNFLRSLQFMISPQGTVATANVKDVNIQYFKPANKFVQDSSFGINNPSPLGLMNSQIIMVGIFVLLAVIVWRR